MTSTSTTPRTLSAGSSIPFSALAQYVNHPMRVLLVPIPVTSSTTPSTPANGLPSRTAQGTLYTVDHHTQCLVLTTPSTSSTSTTNKSSSSTTTTRNYSFHLFSSIQSTTLLSTLPDPSLPPLSTSTSKNTPDLRMDQEEMKLRIEKGVAALVKERSRKPPQGVVVTPETQALFDGLAKTMPVRWHGAQIIVMDQVIISPPYTVDQVKGEKGAHEGVERVKKVFRHPLTVVVDFNFTVARGTTEEEQQAYNIIDTQREKLSSTGEGQYRVDNSADYRGGFALSAGQEHTRLML